MADEVRFGSGAPLDVLDFKDRTPREIYGFGLLLVRPDLHVDWRGNQIPEDVGAIVSIAVGRAAASDYSANQLHAG